MRRIGLGIVLVLGLSGPAWAQEPAEPDTQAQVAELKRQVQVLIGEVAKLSTAKPAPALTKAEQLAKDHETYTVILKQMIERAKPPCKALGGKFDVVFDSSGKPGSVCRGL